MISLKLGVKRPTDHTQGCRGLSPKQPSWAPHPHQPPLIPLYTAALGVTLVPSPSHQAPDSSTRVGVLGWESSETKDHT